VYRFNGSSWSEYKVFPFDELANQRFGYSVSISGGSILSGAYSYGTNREGAAYIHQMVAQPAPVSVSNGKYTSRNKISWKCDSDRAEKFKIFRDGAVLDSTSTNILAYYDYEAVPGKVHSYSVSASAVDWGETFSMPALGWQQTNGEFQGTVKTLYGAGVDSVEISVLQDGKALSSSLEFDGQGAHVRVKDNDKLNFGSDEFTIEAWIKNTNTAGSPWKRIVTKRGGNSSSWYSLCLNNSKLTLELHGSEINSAVSSGPEIQGDGLWHHVAATRYDDGEISYFIDGIEYYGGSFDGNMDNFEILEIGKWASETYDGETFKGYIDEVRLWNIPRKEPEIQADMYKKLKGDEYGLAAYWTFDDLPDRTPEGFAGNYAEESGCHGVIYGAEYSDEICSVQSSIITNTNGRFSMENIYYGESALFELIPEKWGHGFDPAVKYINLSMDTPVQKSVDFIDTTALTITGTIKFAGTDCGVSGVKILQDGTDINISTNANGDFMLPIEQPGIYNLQPSYGDSAYAHKFVPASMNLNVDKDVLGLQFSDTTRRMLSGKFRASCDVVIGSADIEISCLIGEGKCFKDTITTDAEGKFNIILPAQEYLLDIIQVYPTDPQLLAQMLLQYFSIDTVDLTWKNAEHDFIYRRPPEIRVTGWPDFGSGDYNVPILEQSEPFVLEIEVVDTWGELSCPVSQGTITIRDDISDLGNQPITAELEDGLAFYRCWPGEPNLLSSPDPNVPSYQKLLYITARTGEETVEFSQWAVVTGSHLRGSEFYTIATPEMPLWVLHDPPGDESYSFFSKDSTYSRSVRSSWHYQGGGGIFAELRPCIIASFGWSAGLGAETTWSTDFGVYGIIDASFMWGRDQEQTSTKVVTFTSSQEFRTSDKENFLGDEGDIYIGASFNDEFALADILEYDWVLHEVDRDTALVFLKTNFGTDFIYTESHIKQVLVPQLKELARISVANGNSSLANRYNDQIAIWVQHLEKNRLLKLEDNQNTMTQKNYSFSAGTYTTNAFTTHPKDTAWLNFDQFTFDYEGRLGAGAVVAGCTYELGLQGYYHTVAGTEYETKIQTTETYGYTLADDDPGDFFSVDVDYQFRMLPDGTEQMYGPPIFRLVSGVSSNPWEKGTQARDGVNIALNKYVQFNVEPDEQAPFILYLGNTSESGEERKYHLSVIQSSNLEGAIIRVGGVVIEDHLSYTIPAGEQLKATLSGERGPVAYDYENIKVKFYAPGDEETIADTVMFSVHYISPCSDVNLLVPENNWVVNISNNDTMQFVINEYDLNNPHLETILFQYRRAGDSWSTAFTYAKNDIAYDFILEYWDISHLPDGEYELRAVSDCGQRGVKYSSIASGIIDRSALIVLGSPQPSDGILNLGEDIYITFSGEVDEGYLADKHVSLMTADDSTLISVTAASYMNTVYINPANSLEAYENRRLTASISGIRDKQGNRLRSKETWSFVVNMNPVHWVTANVETSVYQDAEGSFSSRLQNSGGEDQSFSITDYPSWLTPNNVNGSIPAGGELEIIFAINSQLNVGSYNDTVFVSTSKGEEYLLVSLKVLHEPPDWTLDAAAYTYSMNLTAQLYIEDTLSRDPYDILSVFIEDELRGAAKVEYVESVDRYFVFITVYSNKAADGRMVFRIWDASAGKEYAYLGSSYLFESNGSIGTISNPLVLEPDANVQVIEMNAGWTWFSCNVETGANSVNSALQSLEPVNGDVVKGQAGFCQFYEGVGWIGSLRRLEIGGCYQMYLQDGGQLQSTGIPVDVGRIDINLYRGWNWIGYLGQKIMNVSEALAAVDASDGDRIKSQTEFASYVEATDSWEGSLKNMVPGGGYNLYTAQSGSLQYPFLGKNSAAYADKPDWELDYNAFEYNMTVTAVVEFDKTELMDSTLIIAAFKDDICCGLSSSQYEPDLDRYLVFLPVYSNNAAGDSITLKVYESQTSKLRDVQDKIYFENNTILGDLELPVVINALPVGDEIVPLDFYLKQNYPNPFNGKTLIEYGIPADQKVDLSIYNTLGQKVFTVVNRRQEARRYTISFDAVDAGLASGLYFYQIKAGDYIKRRKFVFIK